MWDCINYLWLIVVCFFIINILVFRKNLLCVCYLFGILLGILGNKKKEV